MDGKLSAPYLHCFQQYGQVIHEVRKAATEKFNSYIREIVNFTPAFKEAGVRMVRFAIREPKLFQLIFMTENQEPVNPGSFFGNLGEYEDLCTSVISRDYGLNMEESKVLFQHMWTYTYGISALCATHMCMFPEKDITSRIGTEFLAITSLIKSGNMYTTTPDPVPGNNPKDFKTHEILDKIKEQSAK